MDVTDKDCRTCMTVDQLMKRARELLRSRNENANEDKHSEEGPSKDVNKLEEKSENRRTDCPLDIEKLGRSTWDLLHTMAANYPDKPTAEDKYNMETMMNTLGKVYPCEHCAKELRKHLEKHPPNVESRETFSVWMCEMHNKVNEGLGKPKFDCRYWRERWLDGWKDGSCDY
uniref:Sulfhydryl oxidase n=1 Tax=Syphacia muris TaxID=451379 RepID=A0A0N5APG7_9BILA